MNKHYDFLNGYPVSKEDLRKLFAHAMQEHGGWRNNAARESAVAWLVAYEMSGEQQVKEINGEEERPAPF